MPFPKGSACTCSSESVVAVVLLVIVVRVKTTGIKRSRCLSPEAKNLLKEALPSIEKFSFLTSRDEHICFMPVHQHLFSHFSKAKVCYEVFY
jgi:hypothetical protein